MRSPDLSPEMLDGLREQGAWEGPINWDEVLDDSFLPEDQQSK